jgi:hypothetical protein
LLQTVKKSERDETNALLLIESKLITMIKEVKACPSARPVLIMSLTFESGV